MASPEMIARLNALQAGELKILAQGFGQKPRNGADAAEYLAQVPDEQLTGALDVLAKAPATVPTAPPILPSATIAPIPTAPPVSAAATVPTAQVPAKPAAKPAESAKTVRLCTRRRVEATHNGHTFVFAPEPRDCTPCPIVVAEYFAAYFEANDIRYQTV